MQQGPVRQEMRCTSPELRAANLNFRRVRETLGCVPGGDTPEDAAPIARVGLGVQNRHCEISVVDPAGTVIAFVTPRPDAARLP